MVECSTTVSVSSLSCTDVRLHQLFPSYRTLRVRGDQFRRQSLGGTQLKAEEMTDEPDVKRRLLGVTDISDVRGGTPEELRQTDNAAYQSWLRRRIATLERLHTQRLELVAAERERVDALLVVKQQEIDNLKVQLTTRGI
jgi:hypothetical protein